MNERGWFTLLVRGLGLFFALSASGSVSTILAGLVVSWINKPPNTQFAPFGAGSTMQYSLLQGIAHLIPLAAGLYLLFSGGRLIDWLCKSVVGCCTACGHRLGGDEAACPECGVRIRPTT